MQRIAFFVSVLVAGCFVTVGGQAPATNVTVFEHARVIVGDARAPIEDATFVVSGSRFSAGRQGVRRAGARRRNANQPDR
jgi:hypothetical protein